MSKRRQPAQGGFTLIEAIIAMVITGIVAGIVSVYMTIPINNYLDSRRRAELTDVADNVLRRMAFELRRALPNSVAVNGAGTTLSFIPAKDGGRYRSYTSGDPLAPGDTLDGTIVDTLFDVLGPSVNRESGDFLVIFNTGQTGLDAYVGDNRRTISGVAGISGNTIGFTNAAAFPAYESPGQRFQIVPKEGPVEYVCNTTNKTLTRRTNFLSGFSSAGVEQSALLASNVSSCVFDYEALNAVNGLVTLRLGIKPTDEEIMLLHQIHVDNTP